MTDYGELVKALRCIDMMGSCPCDYSNLCQNFECITDQAAAAIEKMQAQLEDRTNQDEEDKILEDLRNVPVRPIGPIEPMQIELLTKRGEWIEEYAGPGLSNYKCSLCGKICGAWRRGLKPSELPNWCGNCGADMRKMEIQK